MVEITYQMVLSTIQTIGILIGIYYYIMTLRNQNRTRQEQWLLQLYHSKADHEAMQRFFKYMEATWDDYEDYLEKYDSSVNTEYASIRHSIWNFYNSLGLIVKEGKVDINMVYSLYNWRIIAEWFKGETIIKRLREGVLGPDHNVYFEYLADEMIRMRQERGFPLPVELLHPTSTLHQELKT